MIQNWKKTALIVGAGAFAAAAVLIASVACGGDDNNGDAEEIEQTINDVAAAWEAQDWEAFKALHTEQGLKAQLADADDPESEAGLQEAFELFSEEDVLKVQSIDEIEVSDATATADALSYTQSREEPSFASLLILANTALVEDDGAWKIDGVAYESPEVPEGTTTVHVDANEFAFGLNTADITSGNVAFEVANVGNQPHHFVLEQIPADLDVEAALQSDEEPDTVYIGSTPPWGPGETFNMVFTNELEPGRYVMLCFMPDTDDPEGAPHAMKGMWKDFTIA